MHKVRWNVSSASPPKPRVYWARWENLLHSLLALIFVAATIAFCRLPIVDAEEINNLSDLVEERRTGHSALLEQNQVTERNWSETSINRDVDRTKPHAEKNGKKTTEDFEYELGEKYGLISGTEVPLSVVQSVIQGADQGNKDSLYFLGLLKLYGISVSADENKARELIRKAAELRHLDAMAALGVMLLHGRGGGSDHKAAVAWFRLAAATEHTEAMWILGRMYYEGKGVDEVDFSEAGKWFYRAASTGSVKGQYYMGVLHEYGLGVVKDQRKASEWHARAARQGLAESDYHLGLMKAHGRGFAQDFSEAALHFHKAAKLHHAPSMMYLGKMCLHGQGFPVDYDMALLWFEKAADQGTSSVSREAAAARDELRYSLLEAARVNSEVVEGYDRENVDGVGEYLGRDQSYPQAASPT